ncbi:hypothetical protein F511_38134 [Dorcoceras hygrometricum]|uniref:Uncharacterized protein n=1 Tax=Dorcoceras hygrometricum TaxID=472368 RepID=A0A2Z7D9U6_9LAMI|nr:hypothetical protein F511_38134 [Dorcoceras hygrometricum]
MAGSSLISRLHGAHAVRGSHLHASRSWAMAHGSGRGWSHWNRLDLGVVHPVGLRPWWPEGGRTAGSWRRMGERRQLAWGFRFGFFGRTVQLHRLVWLDRGRFVESRVKII